MTLINRIRVLNVYIPRSENTRNMFRKWCEKAVIDEGKKKPVNVPGLKWVLV
jgi:RNA binding exosome subunit